VSQANNMSWGKQKNPVVMSDSLRKRESQLRRRSRRKVVVLVIISVVVLGGLGYIFIGSEFGFLKMRKLQEENSALEKEIETLKDENLRLRKDLEDEEARLERVEKLAREGLGLSEPDEIIFRFVQPPSDEESTE